MITGDEGCCKGLWGCVMLVRSGEEVVFLNSAGTGTLRASASAVVIADALWKRVSGSLAMLFKMTSERAGGIRRLMRAGGVGFS